MAEKLCIKVMNFKRAMVYVRAFVRAQEKGVVVNIILASVDMRKQSNISLTSILFLDIKPIRRGEIEVIQIELPLRDKVSNTESIVTELKKHNVSHYHVMWGGGTTLCTAAGPSLNLWNLLILFFSSSKL
jgi:hypothetical protein